MRKPSFLQLGREQRGRIVLASCMQLLGGGAYIAEIVLLSRLIESRLLWQRFVLLLLIVLLVKMTVSRLLAWFSANIALGVKYHIRQLIFRKVRELGPGYSDALPTASLIANVLDGVESMEIFFGRFLPQLLYSLIMPLVLFAVTLNIYPLFAWVMLAAVPVLPLSMMFISKWAVKSMGGFWTDFQSLSSVFLENIQGMLTLKLFNRSEQRSREMKEKAWEFRNATMELLRMQLTSITVMDTLVYGFAGAGILIGLLGFASGKVAFPAFFVLLMLSVEFFLPLRQLGSQFHAGVNGIQAGKQIAQFLQVSGLPAGDGEAALPSEWNVEFRNVSFAYSPDLPEVLSGVSMQFAPGKIYGISGPSGCGKSTMGRLLLRFHDPSSGSILYGGVPLSSIPPRQLRRHVTLVDTQSRIFDGTIADNLRLADETAETSRMVEVCRRAGLGALVKKEEDLQKKTGEGGALLSSGERQRLSIARAILLNPDVYVFDEAAGSVDAESEQIIRKTIYSLAGEKTVFIISHRMSMLEGVDEHYVIQGGRLCLK